MTVCKLCGKKITITNKCGLCRECRFRQKYPQVDALKHAEFLIEIKNFLKEKNISYERLADITNYEPETIKKFMQKKEYSEEVKNRILESLKMPRR